MSPRLRLPPGLEVLAWRVEPRRALLDIRAAGGTVTIELRPDDAGPAFARAGDCAVTYRGSSSQLAAQVATAVAAAIRDGGLRFAELGTEAPVPPAAPRPPAGAEPLVDVLHVLAGLGVRDGRLLGGVADLRRHGGALATFELSQRFLSGKARGAPRVTVYQDGDDPSPTLTAFLEIAGDAAAARRLVDAIRPVVEARPALAIHAGVALHPEGVSAKLYITAEPVPGATRAARLRAVASALDHPVDGVEPLWLGCTLGPTGNRRVRLYERAPAPPDDALADAVGSVGRDLEGGGGATLYRHYLGRALLWEDAAARLHLAAAERERFAAAFAQVRVMHRLIATSDEGSTWYGHVGANAPYAPPTT